MYGENVDLGDLVRRILEFAKDTGVREAAERFQEVYSEALLGLSVAPPGREKLTGMSIWCPVRGDTEGVSRYYRTLEFERATGWMDFLRSGKRAASSVFCIYGFWGLELVEARAVEELFLDPDPENRSLVLKLPDRGERFSGDLVEGEYTFHGGAGSICFPNYVGLREFVRKVLEVRKGREFEALRGCCVPGWVIGGDVCQALLGDFLKYKTTFFEVYSGDDEDLALYAQLTSSLRRAGSDGVLVFHPLVRERKSMARFTVSVSDEVKDRLDAFAEENGYNRSEALELMIERFFAEPSEVKSKAAAPAAEGDVAEVWEFLRRQYDYLVQLHEVVVDNAGASTSLVPSHRSEVEFYEPGEVPPKPPG